MSYVALILFCFFSSMEVIVLSVYGGDAVILIIGLGNPGKEYSGTRHNIGFITVDELVKQYHSSFSAKKKFHCEISKVSVENLKLIFVKPTTFMNLSGRSVSSIKAYYNISLKNIYVIHDDIDLVVGRIKIKNGGGNGGHNGLKSIDQVVGRQYNRIRIGVGRPQNKWEVADYVLRNFEASECKVIKQAVDKVTNNFRLILDNKLDEFRNKIA